MNLDFEAWKQFAIDHWVVIVIAVIALFIVLNVVKTVLKWVLVAAIVIGVFVYGGVTVNDLKEVGTQAIDKAKGAIEDEAAKAMAKEAEEATYTLNDDQTFTVKTPNLELHGVPNSGEVEVKFRGASLGTWKMEGAVRKLVEAARQSSK
ncbi:hypothetical protein [Cohnella sp. REN36]|uniref:hypothetical protein n=1 Tax=Cohnella sp. REN36 TaxID=2887347 RepID=UPI001D138787|nr:hypothetical protein [Cohnella sp. REN36]MCC3374667.1 hypothetical protein [Cohnella sp. REN36]